MHVLGSGILQRFPTFNMQQLRCCTSREARALFTPEVGTIEADRVRYMNGRRANHNEVAFNCEPLVPITKAAIVPHQWLGH